MLPLIISSLLETEGKSSKIFFPLKLAIFLFLIIVFSFIRLGGVVFKNEKNNSSSQIVSIGIVDDVVFAQGGECDCDCYCSQCASCDCDSYCSCFGECGACAGTCDACEACEPPPGDCGGGNPPSVEVRVE